MTKITLNDVGNLLDATTARTTINNNYTTIETAFDNTLSRDGTSPNQMGANLDMNSNRILNLSAPVGETEPLRLEDLVEFNTGGPIPIGGTTGQVLAKNSDGSLDTVWKTLSKSDVGLSNVDNTSDATKNSATATLTNKTINTSNNDITIDLSTDTTSNYVSTVGGAAGAIGLTSSDLAMSGSNLQLSAARRTLITRQIFTSGSGTYTPTTGCLAIRVRMVGGGGGGATATAAGSQTNVGAGGGAGGYVEHLMGAGSYTYTVGAGGAAQTNGSNTTFNAGALVAGGGGGTSATTGSGTTLGRSSNSGAGGTASGGNVLNLLGGAGDVALRYSGSEGISARGGLSYLSPPQTQGPFSTNTVTIAGQNYGGGGGGGASGSTSTGTGGAGASGIIIVEEYFN